MKLFISQSGESSLKFAQALCDLVSYTTHGIEPWISKDDIKFGETWEDELRDAIDESHCGIICITKENVNAPWILFEAGALSHSCKEGGGVIPILIDLEVSDLNAPLRQFQGVAKCDKDSMLEILTQMNTLSPYPVKPATFADRFHERWPRMEDVIESLQGS